MKKSLLIKLHVYSGLFTAYYLIAFGLSAIILNHKIEVENNDITKHWESNVKVDTTLSNQELAQEVRDQLGLMGWMPAWEFKKENRRFQFRIVHPGRNYQIDLDLEKGDVFIAEAPKGFVAVFHGLHFLNGKIPNAPLLIRSWQIYQWLALFVMLISLVLGLWLWLKFSYKSWEGIAFGGLFIGSIIIMMLI